MIYIHGGAFAHGDKSQIESLLIEKCLSRKISIATINYRFSADAPYPAPFLDSARAVQYLRLHASEWNLDKRAFAATGGSAGAGMSLWLGFHDDLADPSSADPLKRQSTRFRAVAGRNGQTTYDLRTIATLIDDRTAHIDALLQNNTPMPPSSTGNGIHHPRFGYHLKERMDKLGIECVVKVQNDYDGKPAGQRETDIVEFLAGRLEHPE